MKRDDIVYILGKWKARVVAVGTRTVSVIPLEGYAAWEEGKARGFERSLIETERAGVADHPSTPEQALG